MALDIERQEVGPKAAPGPDRSRGVPGLGLLKGLTVTLKHMLQPSITQQYPDEKPNLPARTRGVIALKAENCTVCYKCSRECPDWCIYIDAHKETHPPAGGGRARSVKVLDRFAIDYALCMYCGICVEVCPFDALFWSPEFEYAEYDILNMTHEKERLEEWTYLVKPPPRLEDGAEPPPEAPPTETSAPEAPPTETPIVATAPTPASGAQPPAETAPPRAEPETPSPAPGPSGAGTEAPRAAAPAGPREHVEPDQETYDRVLAEEVAKGTDRRVAEGRAKSAAIRAARQKAGG
jgi:formate hydrogenlyase subunit 6/NADH:ubiquinone oxidoreductase subunit I